MSTEITDATDVDLEWALAELSKRHLTFPERALRTMQANREAAIPRLIEAIEQSTASVAAGDKNDSDLSFFGLVLLTEFKAYEAWPAIRSGLALPGRGPFEIFGDLITATLPGILAFFCADHMELIDELLANRSLNEYVRWAAAAAYLPLVKEGRISREDAIARLQNALREAIANQDCEGVTGCVSELYDYAATEAAADIQLAFDQQLVEPLMIVPEDLDYSYSGGQSHFEAELSRCKPPGIEDTVEELGHWYWPGEKTVTRDAAVTTTVKAGQLTSGSGATAHQPNTSWMNLDRQHTPSVAPTTIRNGLPRIGRNDYCPCGSGKKFKKCCGSHS